MEINQSENNRGFILSSNEIVKWSVADFGYNKTLNVDASKFAFYYPTNVKPDSEGYISDISLQFIQNQLPDFEEPFDSNKDNIYNVVIKAEDKSGNVTMQPLKVNITDDPSSNDPTNNPAYISETDKISVKKQSSKFYVKEKLNNKEYKLKINNIEITDDLAGDFELVGADTVNSKIILSGKSKTKEISQWEMDANWNYVNGETFTGDDDKAIKRRYIQF